MLLGGCISWFSLSYTVVTNTPHTLSSLTQQIFLFTLDVHFMLDMFFFPHCLHFEFQNDEEAIMRHCESVLERKEMANHELAHTDSIQK